jgi:alkylated DNA repair dioxygenase AlkB
MRRDNLLPSDGELYWLRGFFAKDRADAFYNVLLSGLAWRQERLFIYGRWYNVPRMMAWYGDDDANYRYSGVDHQPLAWNDTLLDLRQAVQDACGQPFNSVLANLYRDGRDSMGCHADDEQELGVNPLIASLSFGDSRRLRFKHNRSGHRLHIDLGHGDLLIMAGNIQHHWRHELPKTRLVKLPRINLTFRRIMPVP